MLYKIGAIHQVRDHNFEKTKYLETIYEKINEKKTKDIKETTADYCSKFLNYGKKEIENVTNR